MTTTDRDVARRRRAVAREGYLLRKSRRDGTFCIVDPYRNVLEAYAPYDQDGYGLSLADVDAWLADSLVPAPIN